MSNWRNGSNNTGVTSMSALGCPKQRAWLIFDSENDNCPSIRYSLDEAKEFISDGYEGCDCDSCVAERERMKKRTIMEIVLVGKVE
jgi:hypothetical protein